MKKIILAFLMLFASVSVFPQHSKAQKAKKPTTITATCTEVNVGKPTVTTFPPNAFYAVKGYQINVGIFITAGSFAVSIRTDDGQINPTWQGYPGPQSPTPGTGVKTLTSVFPYPSATTSNLNTGFNWYENQVTAGTYWVKVATICPDGTQMPWGAEQMVPLN